MREVRWGRNGKWKGRKNRLGRKGRTEEERIGKEEEEEDRSEEEKSIV